MSWEGARNQILGSLISIRTDAKKIPYLHTTSVQIWKKNLHQYLDAANVHKMFIARGLPRTHDFKVPEIEKTFL